MTSRHYCQETRTFRISSRCHLHVTVALFLSLFILLISPVHAALPLTVTVAASPSTLSPGGSSTLQVTVLSNGYPLRGATITMSGAGSSGSFSADTGLTDTAGRFSTVLSTTSSATGPIHVSADASYTPFVITYVPETSYGSGFTDVVIAVSQQQPVPEPPAQQPVVRPPVGVMSVDQQSGAVPLTIRFDGTGSYDPDGGISDYSWSFGDGSVGNGYVSFHTYENPGIYPAMLTVTDNTGLISLPVREEITVLDSATHANTVGPVAVIEVDHSYGLAPLSVAFDGTQSSDPSGSITLWRWDFGDGTSAVGPMVNHTYHDPGPYTCILTVTGAGGVLTDASLIQIIANPSLPVTGSTNAPFATPPPTTIIVPAGISMNSGVNNTGSGMNNPLRPLSSFIPPSFLPLAGILAGIIVGAVGSVLTRSKPSDPAARKFQEFVKSILGKRGVSAIATWEKKKQTITIIKRREIFASLSLVEILVALASAVLIGAAFYLVSPNPDRFLFTLVLFITAGGAVVVVHDLSRRWVARRHGQYGEYKVWLLGTIIMFLTAGFFGCACGKPSRPVFEDRGDKSTRDRAIECLTGPALSCIFGCLFLVLIPLGGLAATVGTVGFSMNIVLALYSLMPFEPMDGLKVWAWDRAAYVAIFIPLLVIYIGSAYLLR